MRQNKIRELRKARHMTVTTLADKAGLSHPYVVRIENGKRGLSIPVAQRLADALEVPVADVLGIGSANCGGSDLYAGVADDAEPYKSEPGERLTIPTRLGKNIDPWRVKRNVVDRVGVRLGQIVFVDSSADAVEGLRSLQCVVAEVYHQAELSQATTVLRQFIAPSLLITNSSEKNLIPLDIDKGDAFIKGVLVGSFSTF